MSDEDFNSLVDSLSRRKDKVEPGLPIEYNGDDEQTLSHPLLMGTLEIEGDNVYTIYFNQQKSSNSWLMLNMDYISAPKSKYTDYIVAALRAYRTGRLEGYGKTYILTRLMSNISTMTYMCVNGTKVKNGFTMQAEYTQPGTSNIIKFTASSSGSVYYSLDMNYEGFILTLSKASKGMPVRFPALVPVLDTTSKAAVVANLGIKTAATLFRSMGERLDWFKAKNYKLISVKEEFEAMMLDFLRTVQKAANSNKAVLVGLDTETTGLHMYDLAPGNPLRDNVVSIPFAWENNKAFVICTDMYYFSNIDSEMVYPLFTKLFSRNVDFTFQDIELDFGGEHFKFNRSNINVSGWNVMFDEMAFFTEGCDVFFDEDGRQLFFNLNTDLQQGQFGFERDGTFRISNSLKSQTRRMIGDETLELDELFGKGNEDKYRYLQDETLAILYGGADADYTRSCVRIGRRLTEKSLYKQYRKYDMTTIYQLAKAAWRGMPIDTAAVKRQGDLVNQDIERLKNFIYHYAWLANRDTLQDKLDQVEGLLGADFIIDAESLIAQDKMFRYPFTPSNHKRLLFGLLGYPVVKRSQSNGEPALDKFVLQKLMNPKRNNPTEIMKEDLMMLSDPTQVLVSKDDFNKDAFPLARVFSTYAKLYKEYTSYYRPIMENDTEGRMFYDFTLARAATRRILSPGQTMKGSLKSLVIAPPGKIFMSFDASQIEYRHMASVAYIRAKKQLQKDHPTDWKRMLEATNISHIVHMMQNEEADYHIETAASMTGVRQHEVTPKVRKRYKSIGFGIPYGLGERSMCESLHSGVVNDETMKETRELLADYYVKQSAIIDMLEEARDSAFFPAPISEEYRKYLGVGDGHVGIVRNFTGFYRLFVLENLTRARTARIRRQAGNCIIQGGAAELFRRMLYNFHIGCCKAGIENKVQWLMTVHDELDAIIDADIDIMCLIKVLYENCTLRYEDHIPYYIGINFGANWQDAKSDANELPVIMVQRMIAAYDAGKFSIPCDGRQAEYLLKLKRHYMCDRVGEVLQVIIPKVRKGYQYSDDDIALIDDKFENYVVRSYMDVFSTKGADLRQRIEAWQKAREEYGFGVDFLQERFDIPEEDNLLELDDLGDVSFDLDDMDLSLELLSEDDDIGPKTEDVWFNEASLFDQNASADEIVVDAESSGFTFVNDEKEQDDFVVNKNPTNSFDVFVSTHYVRTKVLRIKEDTYSVLLAGTEFAFIEKSKELARMIKKHFPPGNSFLLIIGEENFFVKNVSYSDEDLNWLDKLILNYTE